MSQATTYHKTVHNNHRPTLSSSSANRPSAKLFTLLHCIFFIIVISTRTTTTTSSISTSTTHFDTTSKQFAQIIANASLSSTVYDVSLSPSDSAVHQQRAARSPSERWSSYSTVHHQNICNYCQCNDKRERHNTISCDFRIHSNLSNIFDHKYNVPSNFVSISIKLDTKTDFRLMSGFLTNSKINSLVIQGVHSVFEQVEIGTDAFLGNNGPYPDIQISSVYRVFVRRNAFSKNCKFNVSESNQVWLETDAFKHETRAHFTSINDLRMSENAFNSASARLYIESSHIENIYRFESSLHEISFINCSIDTINDGAFDVTNINVTLFESCRIGTIRSGAITEKLYSNRISITDATIDSIESEAISGSGINELIMKNNTIGRISRDAIYVSAINATITRNNITYLGNNWLRVKDWSNVVVRNNNFGIFGRMMLEQTKAPVSCIFEKNALTKPQPGSLNFTEQHCNLREISIDEPCTCTLNWLDALTAHDLRSETYCTLDDKLQNCFKSNIFNALKFLNVVCDNKSKQIDCAANNKLIKKNGYFFTNEESEEDQKRLPKILFILCGVLALLVLGIVASYLTYHYCSGIRTKEDNDDNASNIFPHVDGHIHQFSNEDLCVIERAMQFMQKQYPKMYKNVCGRMQILLQRELTDKKCIKCISHIVNLLNKEDGAMIDFAAFNRVLTQHLQPPMPTAPPNIEPTYSEPGMDEVGLDDGFYTSNTIVVIPTENYGAAQHTSEFSGGGMGGACQTGNNKLPEHIYAELSCAQQPLLPNEYASPLDRNLDTMELYSEPINAQGKFKY